jgi:hypothetical protein
VVVAFLLVVGDVTWWRCSSNGGLESPRLKVFFQVRAEIKIILGERGEHGKLVRRHIYKYGGSAIYFEGQNFWSQSISISISGLKNL